MARKKPRYRTAVAERYLDAPRSDIWAHVLTAFGNPASLDDPAGRSTRAVLVDGETIAVSQVVISQDQPWRLVTDIADAPVPFHQEAVVLMPRPARHAAQLGPNGHLDGCIAMLSVLVGPDAAADTAYSVAVAAEVEARLDLLLRGVGLT